MLFSGSLKAIKVSGACGREDVRVCRHKPDQADNNELYSAPFADVYDFLKLMWRYERCSSRKEKRLGLLRHE